jgi:hypothetical protein
MHFTSARSHDAGQRFAGLDEGQSSLGLASPGEAGTYLTDGLSLYRVVAPISWGERHAFALLEDCMSLDVVAFTADQLASVPLTRVMPRPAPGVSRIA